MYCILPCLKVPISLYLERAVQGHSIDLKLCHTLLNLYFRSKCSQQFQYFFPYVDFCVLFKVSHHVDHTGKIFMTYLTSWNYPESNLLGLIQACRDAFGELPPVFSKVSSQTNQQQQPPHQTTQEAPGLLQNSRQDHRVSL